MHPLEPDDYTKLTPLFQDSHLTLVSDSVIAGNTRPLIWVDDADHPRSALMWDVPYCIYLAGDADNAGFNQQLRDHIQASLLPELQQTGHNIFKVYFTPSDWADQIEMLFPNVSLTPRARTLLTYEQSAVPEWRPRVPRGFSVQPVRELMREGNAPKNLPWLLEEVLGMWSSVDSFLSQGFGYAVLDDATGDIVCWCTAEYVSATKCGIGIETQLAYQNRGLAKLATCALVEEALDRGLMPHWEAWSANLPSIAVAERVGFQKVLDFTVFLGQIEAAQESST